MKKVNKQFLLDTPAQKGSVKKLSFGKWWFKPADPSFEKKISKIY